MLAATEAAVEGASHMTEYLIILTNLLLVAVTAALVLLGIHDSRKHREVAQVEHDRHAEALLDAEGARDAAEMRRLAHIIETVLEDEREKETAVKNLRSA